MTTSLVLALVGLLVGATGSADFDRVFAPTKDPARRYDARVEALAALQGDDEEVATSLLDALEHLEREAVQLEHERSPILGDDRTDKPLQGRWVLDPQRKLQLDVLQRVLAFESEDAADAVVTRALRSRKLPLQLRVTLASMVDHASTSIQRTLDRALRDSDAATALVALRTVDRSRWAAEASDESDLEQRAEACARLLEHRFSIVRDEAARALARLAHPAGIEPLIQQLERDDVSLRSQETIAASLAILTRMNLGLSVRAWRAWWNDHEEDVRAGTVSLGGGEAKPVAAGAGNYYGIPIVGDHVLFVIDVSLSMNRAMEGGRSVKGKDTPVEDQRITYAKAELIQALESLPDTKTFNIVVFDAATRSYEYDMVRATPKRVRHAKEWVEALVPKRPVGTALYDAVDLGFRLGGRPVDDQMAELRFDTLFLLSDGAPTAPRPDSNAAASLPGGGPSGRGQRDSNAAILDAVTRWNLLNQVRIHTIGLGRDTDARLLKSLADQHGGRFVKKAG